jgi:hypothetical protein
MLSLRIGRVFLRAGIAPAHKKARSVRGRGHVARNSRRSGSVPLDKPERRAYNECSYRSLPHAPPATNLLGRVGVLSLVVQLLAAAGVRGDGYAPAATRGDSGTMLEHPGPVVKELFVPHMFACPKSK